MKCYLCQDIREEMLTKFDMIIQPTHPPPHSHFAFQIDTK